jgi:hypothetical protein
MRNSPACQLGSSEGSGITTACVRPAGCHTSLLARLRRAQHGKSLGFFVPFRVFRGQKMISLSSALVVNFRCFL